MLSGRIGQIIEKHNASWLVVLIDGISRCELVVVVQEKIDDTSIAGLSESLGNDEC